MRTLPAKSRLLSILFMLLGGAVLYIYTVAPLLSYWQSVPWQPTPATLTHLELISVNSGENKSYRIDASYHYEFAGQRYSSNRASLLSDGDKYGSYWQSLYNSLQHRRQQNQITAWVNPNSPSEAALDRGLRPWWLTMASAFAVLSVGLGLRLKPEAGNAEERPGTIDCEQKNDYQMPLFLSSSLLALSTVIGLTALLFESSLQLDTVFVLMFAATAAAITWQMMRQRQRYFRLGRTPLTLNPNPASANGHIGGVISIGGQLQAPLTLTLQCIQLYTKGSDDDKKTVERVLWSEQSTSWPAGNPQRQCFVFTTEGQRATHDSSYGSVFWRLRAKGELLTAATHPAEKFNRSWLIPVSEAKAHTSLSIPDNHAQQTHRHFEVIASDMFRVHQQGQELCLASVAGRSIKRYLGQMVGGVLFTAIGLSVFADAVHDNQKPWFEGALFALIGLAVLIPPLWPIGKQLKTRVSPGGFFIERSWFGLPIYRRSIPHASPQQLRKKKTSSQKIDGEHREFYTLYLSTKRKNVCLAEGVDGSASAEALLDRMRQALTGHLDDELGT